MSEVLCQVCGEAVVDEKVYCSRCHAPHHRDCWEFNKGCSIFGCGGTDCLKAPLASDSAGEVVYIEESTVPPALPPPEASRKRVSFWHDSRMIWVATLVAVLSLGNFERDETTPPPMPRQSTARRPVPPRPIFQAILKRDVTDAAGRVAIPAGTRVQAYWPQVDRRYRIRAEGKPECWVAADAFERVRSVSVDRSSALTLTGLGQLVTDLPELPRGQFVLLSRPVPIPNAVPGLKIRAFGQQAWTERQRYVVLGPNDVQRVSSAKMPLDVGSFAAVARSMWKPPRDGKPSYAIVVERTPTGAGMLEPGTFLRVTQLESSGGEPAYILGENASGQLRVPASACRPVLASKLRSEARRQLAQR